MRSESPVPARMRVRVLAEGGILIAAAQLLSAIKMFELPSGGSVTAASMVPIVVFALRWGFKWGLGVSLTHGALQFILGPQWIPALSSEVLAYLSVIVLDYLVAFGILSLAGLFRGRKRGLFFGTAVALTGRFLVHFVSGLVLWSEVLDGDSIWYSLTYNGGYMGVELLISLGVCACIYRPLKRYFVTG